MTGLVPGAVLSAPVVRAIQDQKVSPGVLGFLVVAALGVATWLLIRSMGRQIKRIDFSEDAIDVEQQLPPVADAEPVAEVRAGEVDGSPRVSADGDDAAGTADPTGPTGNLR
jgi:hypothetical protein